MLGGVERYSGKVFLKIARDRSARTLIQIIQKWVAPGTTIITDEFGAYKRLRSLGFKHRTVCHKYNFVNPRTGAHTQTIECLWQHVLALLPRHGMRPTKLHTYLDEFIYRRFNSNKGDGVLADLIHFQIEMIMWRKPGRILLGCQIYFRPNFLQKIGYFPPTLIISCHLSIRLIIPE